MSESQLRKLSVAIATRQAKLRVMEQQRNALIQTMLAEGRTHAQIADAANLTRGRIGQIAQRQSEIVNQAVKGR